jgi:choline dehydrogenase-like flavoprotein
MISESHDGIDSGAHEVCVIGAGPVGISLAVRLQQLGRRVLVLESGGLAADRAIQDLATAEIEYPKAHDSMRIATARRLGGTSNLWGGRCLPFDEVDFSDRPGLVDARWPIPLAAIAPFYRQACDFVDCGEPQFVSPAPDAPEAPEGFRFDALERWSGTPRLQKRHRRALEQGPLIDIRLKTVVTGFEYADDGRVSGLTIVRPDGSGRRTIAARTVVIATGGIEATRLLLAEQRDRPGLFGGVDGPLGRYHMAHVCGVIADITLADAAMDGAFDFFRAPDGVYVRRRFAPSQDLLARERFMNISFWPVVPEIADASHGSGPLSAIFLGLAWGPVGRVMIPEALRNRHIPANLPPFGPHLLNVVRNLPSTIPYVLDFMLKRYASDRRVPGFFLRNPKYKYGLYYHSEQWPNPDNRITLTDRRDRTGLPVAHIGYHFHQRDAQSVLRAHEVFEDWLKRAGLGSISHRFRPEERAGAILGQAKHGPHQIGMTRMAADAREGVVDGDLRTFSAANLYVASCSSLPTASQANPTLTAIALALRLAEHLAAAQDAPLNVS